MIVKIPYASVHALSSDLLAGQVKLALTMPLNDETMRLREQLAMLKILDTPVIVEITSPQRELPTAAQQVELIEQTADFGAPPPDETEISADPVPAPAPGEPVLRSIARADQSPMNEMVWLCHLECGHEQWVTSKRKPTRQIACDACGAITPEQRERLINQLTDRVFDAFQNKAAEVASEERPKGKARRGKGGTTSLTYEGKTVTLTNEQFSKAARRVAAEGRALAASQKSKRKAKR